MSRRDYVDKRLTKGFIRVSPAEVVLHSHTKTRTAAGGWTWVDGVLRSPQLLAVIPVVSAGTGRSAEGLVLTVDGVEQSATYIIVGDEAADIRIGDTFTLRGSTHRIVHVMPANGYETRGVSVRHG